jgi:enoyl-CoA hydratase
MGVIQKIAPDPGHALEAALAITSKIAACGPLGIKTTLASAHQSIDESEAGAFSKLDEQYAALYRTEGFVEGRTAETGGRPPGYHGR